MRTGRLFVMTCLLAASAAVRAELDATELQIAAWIDANAGAAEALIERSVNINSGTMNFAGVRAVGSIFEAELEALGFATEWLDMSAVNRAGHLFARRNDSSAARPGVLLIGHLDTVFAADDAFQQFARDPERGVATGPGVLDMKSGNAIIVQALAALDAVGALGSLPIVVALTGDEESPGAPLELSRAALVEAGRRADIALGFEEGTRSDGIDYAVVTRRGSSTWSLEVTGRQAHSSRIFSDEVGAGAIFEAARILNDFYETLRGEDYLTFNAGSVLGGTDVTFDAEETRGTAFGRSNVVPRRVVVQGGIRTISAEQLERARETMRAIAADNLPQTSATIGFRDGYPAMPPTDGNRRLGELLSTISEDLGGGTMPAIDPLQRGAADISFVAPYADALDGLGAPGGGGHSPDEYLELDLVPLATKRAAILIYRLANSSAWSERE